MQEVDNNIGIVFVLYNPTIDDIQNVIKVASVSRGAIVDNSDRRNFVGDMVGQMTYIPLLSNHGIAEAQNRGVECLMTGDDSLEYLIFMDQDSRCPLSYYNAVRDDYIRLRQIYPKLAMIGPTHINMVSGDEYHSIFHRDNTDDNAFTVRREIILSGACVSVPVFRQVGGYESALFIDFVDFEWCWRAQALGYICGVTMRLQLLHQVGLGEISFGSYKVIVSSPLRYYYQYRNHLRLCTRKYVPLQWKLATLLKHAARLVYLPLCVNNGRKCFSQMIRGIKDSLV